MIFNKKKIERTSVSKDWNTLKMPTGEYFFSLCIVFALYPLFTYLLNLYEINFSRELKYLVVVLLNIPLHEISHALFFPDRPGSENIVFGVLPKKLSFYVHYKGSVSKIRFLLSLLSPILLLTVLPFILILGLGLENNYLIYFVQINWLLSGHDFLVAVMILLRTPANSRIKDGAEKFYWRVCG